MPSKKPQFVIRAEQEILDKIAYIASENERSSTQEIAVSLLQSSHYPFLCPPWYILL